MCQQMKGPHLAIKKTQNQNVSSLGSAQGKYFT